MNQDIRREIISKNLGIKPINHGQVYAFQIALPDSRKQAVTLEQRQAIERSLLAHQSNLVSLIIRRTDAYNDDDIEYELVYGAEWLQAAQKLDIEKVWAWVFDMTDEQVIGTISEMESLITVSREMQPTAKVSEGINSDIAALIDKKLQLAIDSIGNSIASALAGIRNDLDEKLKLLNYRIDALNSGENNSSALAPVLEKLDDVIQQLSSSPSRSKVKSIENPINLLEATDRDIEVALKQVNTQSQQINAAIEAVRYWKQSEQGLTWGNLETSVRAKRDSPDKIQGFAKGTYQRLCAIAIIPNKENAT
jgi:hypothetical protein